MCDTTITHLAVTNTVDHLVVFTVEGMCHEAQALQERETGQFIAQEERLLLLFGKYVAKHKLLLLSRPVLHCFLSP